MSTIDVAASARVAERAAAAGLDYLRAPVSGNPVVVAAGNLTIVASGPAPALERVRPLLGAIGPNLFHVGEGEQARVMKLVLNLMIAATNQMLSEALATGEANGLGREQMLEVMSGLGGRLALRQVQGRAAARRRLLADLLDRAAGQGPRPRRRVRRRGGGAGAGDRGDPGASSTAACEEGLGELDMSVVLPLLRREAGLADSLPEGAG